MHNYTQEYFDQFFKIAKIGPKSADRYYHQLKQMNRQELNDFLTQLIELSQDHFDRNLEKISRQTEDIKGPLATHNSWGNYQILEKIALYQEKVVLEDFIQYDLYENRVNPCTYNLHELARSFAEYRDLGPWVNFGFVEVVPSPRTWESLHTLIYDAGESFAEKSFSNIFTSDNPSLKRFLEEEILHDECLSMFSSLYISGMLNDCLPLMDSPIMNKLLGQYMLEYDGYVPTQALIHLNMKDLAYLTNMTPKRIFQIRNDASTSFENFREVWGELTRSMTKKPWEEDFEEEVNNLWEEKMVPEINSVKKDIRNLRLKLALKALAPIPGILHNLKFGNLMGIIEAVFTSLDFLQEIHKYRKEMESKKNSFAYIFYNIY